jgi:hypothetical protein
LSDIKHSIDPAVKSFLEIHLNPPHEPKGEQENPFFLGRPLTTQQQLDMAKPKAKPKPKKVHFQNWVSAKDGPDIQQIILSKTDQNPDAFINLKEELDPRRDVDYYEIMKFPGVRSLRISPYSEHGGDGAQEVRDSEWICPRSDAAPPSDPEPDCGESTSSENNKTLPEFKVNCRLSDWYFNFLCDEFDQRFAPLPGETSMPTIQQIQLKEKDPSTAQRITVKKNSSDRLYTFFNGEIHKELPNADVDHYWITRVQGERSMKLAAYNQAHKILLHPHSKRNYVI